jgi:hypothetical protein
VTDTIHIEMTGHGLGTVTVNGVKVPLVRSVTFHAEPRERNTVTLEVTAPVVEITCIGDVTRTYAATGVQQ